MAISGQAATEWVNNMRAFLKAQFVTRTIIKRQADFNASPPMIPDPQPDDMNHKRAMAWSEVSPQIETEAKAQAEALVDMVLDDLITNLLGFITENAEVFGVKTLQQSVLVDPVTHIGNTFGQGQQAGVAHVR